MKLIDAKHSILATFVLQKSLQIFPYGTNDPYQRSKGPQNQFK